MTLMGSGTSRRAIMKMAHGEGDAGPQVNPNPPDSLFTSM